MGGSGTGVPWDNQIVNIVILMAINRKDTFLFKEFYEVMIYSNQNVFAILKNSDSLNELIIGYSI